MKQSVKPNKPTIKIPNNKNIELRNPKDLLHWEGNPRKHPEKQITALISSIRKFGFSAPIIINEENKILAGHGRLEAALRLKMSQVPVVVLSGLTESEQRAYVIADNKISSLSSWDNYALKKEIELLVQADFTIETTGFSTAEIDLMLDTTIHENSNAEDDLKPEDMVDDFIVSQENDIWHLGKHRLVCGNSVTSDAFMSFGNDIADMCITDPPYNVKISSIGGKGKIKHEEFKMASGEMSQDEFIEFLTKVFSHTSKFLRDGGITYSFMDWRHMSEIQIAGTKALGELKQLCVWAKDNAGMGSFYRSQHELIFVFKKEGDQCINNFELGQHGRYRSNVWNYAGVNTFSGKGFNQLQYHPTVKPVAMIADAIRDCSNRNGIVIDPFAGSGTVILAAERTGRRARAIEIDPKYVDVAIRRWQRVTGENAFHEQSGMTFLGRADYLKYHDNYPDVIPI